MSQRLRILLVEENHEDFLRIRGALDKAFTTSTLHLDRVSSPAEALSCLPATAYEAFLLGPGLNSQADTELRQELRRRNLTAPVLSLTNEPFAPQTLDPAACDCLIRTRINEHCLPRAIQCALSLHRKEGERQQAEEKYRAIFEEAIVGIFQTTPEGRYLSVNPALARIYGYDSPAELMAAVDDIGRQVYVDPQRRQEFKALLEQHQVLQNFEYQVRRKDGSQIWILENARAVRDGSGTVLYYVGTVEDITERRRLEAQLRQSQKMDAVGQLAGGVAHDFNNLLMVISSYAELMLDSVGPEHYLHRKVQEILKASRSAADLTRQLLAFSRKQVQALQVLDLNVVVKELEGMLPRLIGEHIQLVVVSGRDLGKVKADPVQIEQVVMNLAANARDAMPHGGKLTIETSNVTLDHAYIRQHPIVPPGDYVLLAVSDTGTGIPAEHQPHIFEPFFTTKEQGKGTGLGLATVYGIVKQSGGYIWVYSEPGMGATFKIYLPRVQSGAARAEPLAATDQTMRGSETVLLVEDEEAVRQSIREFLALCGYTVLEATDGEDALQVAQQYLGAIDLMVTDVVMPRLGGGQLARQLARERPEMKVLYVSGYAESTILQHAAIDLRTTFLHKPFTLKTLAQKMRQILGAGMAVAAP